MGQASDERVTSKPVTSLPTPPETEDDASDTALNDSCSIPLPPPTKGATQVLDIDKNTPDAHVPRDPRLIRLTGVHPFNVEAPLSALYDEGFLTSPELFYVRNHGAVPHVTDEEIPDWEFSVEGLVENPFTLTLKQLLLDFQKITCPVTLVCAGNRRKEQNQVRKSKGFSWGAAGTSTGLFTGVLMAELMRVAKPKRKAKYVCMEGADKLPNGYYGTSVKLSWVMDPERGIMLAHKMNGEILPPDHGKPLRALIPGQIGGRSVKWLKRLIITEGPSDNWYHLYDNRVLPMSVSPDEAANNPKWWKDERYAIYDLNVNSVIAYPAHDELLSLVNAPQMYRLKGYAYSGGGRRITRAEISIDKGNTWRLADVEYPEDRYRQYEQTLFGGEVDLAWRDTSFCWCFWSLDVAVEELKGAKDILVRAMDESMNAQPRDMYWSVLGMMNNPWFRVTITEEGDSLRFEHPTQPALQPGGWMEKVKKAGGNLTNGFWGEKLDGDDSGTPAEAAAPEIKLTRDDVDTIISVDELRKHDNAQSAWFVLNGHVFDGTTFMDAHPGGAQSIISAAGMDATDEFMAIHSETAKKMMPKYHIGSLDEKSKTILEQGEAQSDGPAEKRSTFLQSRAWTTAALVEKKQISWDTRVFMFQLEHDEQTLGLPVGQHLMVRLRDPVTREPIIRSYTPISEMNQSGRLEMLVKIYFETPKAKGGRMTMALDSLPLGHGVEFKGPIGKFEYLGRGRCSINGVVRTVKSFVMVCAGSGVTPIFQVFRAVMQDPEDGTRCTVFDGNRMVEDILCRDDLEQIATANPGRCNLIFTLSQACEGWTGLKGRVTGELIQKHCTPDPETLVLVCGPQALEKSIHADLISQGYKDSDLLFF
ncbi:hypothetical protein L228DRAFT_210114 [Xylona heveae TC161]|uniref:Nitrate reductase n=1 Tax=Xylona heveae (strain CBS 132557 / TC161) TaxID=1328760 RepID=A0A165HDX5_XYLHT|nr:hypothetical protein L228DRAFT_210114 [Xylona heveae TC161]KZF23362.1 hypothetical protein L228DRAFT_210114 [Xylona heveae TC161]